MVRRFSPKKIKHMGNWPRLLKEAGLLCIQAVRNESLDTKHCRSTHNQPERSPGEVEGWAAGEEYLIETSYEQPY